MSALLRRSCWRYASGFLRQSRGRRRHSRFPPWRSHLPTAALVTADGGALASISRSVLEPVPLPVSASSHRGHIRERRAPHGRRVFVGRVCRNNIDRDTYNRQNDPYEPWASNDSGRDKLAEFVCNPNHDSTCTVLICTGPVHHVVRATALATAGDTPLLDANHMYSRIKHQAVQKNRTTGLTAALRSGRELQFPWI